MSLLSTQSALLHPQGDAPRSVSKAPIICEAPAGSTEDACTAVSPNQMRALVGSRPHLPLRRFLFSNSRLEIREMSSLWSPLGPAAEVVLALCNKEK